MPTSAGDGSAAGRLANVSGAVLLGGASRRMGRDKAHLEIGGRSFASRIALLLEQLFEDVILVGGTPPDDAPGRRVADRHGPQCALRGLVSALEAAPAERLLVVATDLPLVSADLLLALTAWPLHEAVVPRVEARAHPLCALYEREPTLAAARRRLEGGELSLHGLLDALDCSYVEGDDLVTLDPHGEVLYNVNAPEDLERLFAGEGSAPAR